MLGIFTAPDENGTSVIEVASPSPLSVKRRLSTPVTGLRLPFAAAPGQALVMSCTLTPSAEGPQPASQRLEKRLTSAARISGPR